MKNQKKTPLDQKKKYETDQMIVMNIVHVNLWSTVLEMKVYLSHSISDNSVMPFQNSE